MTISFEKTEKIFLENDFSELQKSLASVGRKLLFSKGATIQPRENEILVVLSGKMTVSNDVNNELMLGYTFPYMPVGLMERYYKLQLYYKVESQIEVIQLTGEEFDEVFYHHPENAELLSRIMAYMSSTLIHIYYERNNDSGYATIREMLMRYLYKAEENTLNNEGIATFILKRTRLSRSYVFQILAGLKAGDYITIRNGKLISINRHIPERF